MSDLDRLSVNVPETGGDTPPAYSPRASPRLPDGLPPPPPPPLSESLRRLSTDEPARSSNASLNVSLNASNVATGLDDESPDRPPAYTPSPDPIGLQPMVAPMPLVTNPRRLRDVKHPKLGPINAIQYASHGEQLVFGTLCIEGNGLLSYMRYCRPESAQQYPTPREPALAFAMSPDGETCAIVCAINSSHYDHWAGKNQSLEVRLASSTISSTPLIKKGTKFRLGVSTILDPSDDPCDRLMPYRPLAFSSNGSILAVAVRGHRIILCSVLQGKPTSVLTIHMAEVTHIVFSRHSGNMASCSLDGIVRVTGPEGNCVGKMDQSAYQRGHRRATDLAISHDGQKVVCIWGSRIVIWWPDTGITTTYDLWQTRSPDAEGWPMVLSPCGKLLGCRTAEGMDVLDSHTGDILLKITQPTTITAAAFSVDGDVLTLGRYDGYIESWRIY